MIYMKNIVQFLSENKELSKKRLKEIKDDLFSYIDEHEHEHKWNLDKIMDWLQEDGLVDFADKYNIDDDELNSLLHDFDNIIETWIAEWTD